MSFWYSFHYLSKLKITVNKIIRFILNLYLLPNTDFVYSELNHYNFDKLFKKCLLYLYINIETLFQYIGKHKFNIQNLRQILV